MCFKGSKNKHKLKEIKIKTKPFIKLKKSVKLRGGRTSERLRERERQIKKEAEIGHGWVDLKAATMIFRQRR